MSEESQWDRRYAAADRLFGAEPDAALVEFTGPLPPARAVDLGAGEGRNSLWLARRGWHVVAVDSSQVALDRLAVVVKAEALDVTWVVADVHDFLDRGEAFDLVVVANIHPSPEQRAALFAAAARAVDAGGYLFVIGHHRDSLGIAGPPDPARLYTEQTLKGAFPGLDLLRLERRERPRGEGEEPLVDVVVWAAAPRDRDAAGSTGTGSPG